MFTGIVEEVGRIRSLRRGARSAVLSVEARKVRQGLALGDSVAVNGVCLTVTSLDPGGFTADVMHETLDRSTLGELVPGSPVDLERAMAADGRFGGHIVSGHIDGVGTIRASWRDDNAVWYTVAAPPAVLRYVVEKGSIAIDGISLTVAAVTDSGFSVSVIPHTAASTILGGKGPGDRVDLEAEIIGKYVEKLLRPQAGADTGGRGDITLDFLAEHGF